MEETCSQTLSNNEELGRASRKSTRLQKIAEMKNEKRDVVKLTPNKNNCVNKVITIKHSPKNSTLFESYENCEVLFNESDLFGSYGCQSPTGETTIKEDFSKSTGTKLAVRSYANKRSFLDHCYNETFGLPDESIFTDTYGSIKPSEIDAEIESVSAVTLLSPEYINEPWLLSSLQSDLFTTSSDIRYKEKEIAYTFRKKSKKCNSFNFSMEEDTVPDTVVNSNLSLSALEEPQLKDSQEECVSVISTIKIVKKEVPSHLNILALTNNIRQMIENAIKSETAGTVLDGAIGNIDMKIEIVNSRKMQQEASSNQNVKDNEGIISKGTSSKVLQDLTTGDDNSMDTLQIENNKNKKKEVVHKLDSINENFRFKPIATKALKKGKFVYVDLKSKRILSPVKIFDVNHTTFPKIVATDSSFPDQDLNFSDLMKDNKDDSSFLINENSNLSGSCSTIANSSRNKFMIALGQTGIISDKKHLTVSLERHKFEGKLENENTESACTNKIQLETKSESNNLKSSVSVSAQKSPRKKLKNKSEIVQEKSDIEPLFTSIYGDGGYKRRLRSNSQSDVTSEKSEVRLEQMNNRKLRARSQENNSTVQKKSDILQTPVFHQFGSKKKSRSSKHNISLKTIKNIDGNKKLLSQPIIANKTSLEAGNNAQNEFLEEGKIAKELKSKTDDKRKSVKNNLISNNQRKSEKKNNSFDDLFSERKLRPRSLNKQQEENCLSKSDGNSNETGDNITDSKLNLSKLSNKYEEDITSSKKKSGVCENLLLQPTVDNISLSSNIQIKNAAKISSSEKKKKLPKESKSIELEITSNRRSLRSSNISITQNQENLESFKSSILPKRQNQTSTLVDAPTTLKTVTTTLDFEKNCSVESLNSLDTDVKDSDSKSRESDVFTTPQGQAVRRSLRSTVSNKNDILGENLKSPNIPKNLENGKSSKPKLEQQTVIKLSTVKSTPHTDEAKKLVGRMNAIPALNNAVILETPRRRGLIICDNLKIAETKKNTPLSPKESDSILKVENTHLQVHQDDNKNVDGTKPSAGPSEENNLSCKVEKAQNTPGRRSVRINENQKTSEKIKATPVSSKQRDSVLKAENKLKVVTDDKSNDETKTIFAEENDLRGNDTKSHLDFCFGFKSPSIPNYLENGKSKSKLEQQTCIELLTPRSTPRINEANKLVEQKNLTIIGTPGRQSPKIYDSLKITEAKTVPLSSKQSDSIWKVENTQPQPVYQGDNKNVETKKPLTVPSEKNNLYCKVDKTPKTPGRRSLRLNENLKTSEKIKATPVSSKQRDSILKTVKQLDVVEDDKSNDGTKTVPPQENNLGGNIKSHLDECNKIEKKQKVSDCNDKNSEPELVSSLCNNTVENTANRPVSSTLVNSYCKYKTICNETVENNPTELSDKQNISPITSSQNERKLRSSLTAQDFNEIDVSVTEVAINLIDTATNSNGDLETNNRTKEQESFSSLLNHLGESSVHEPNINQCVDMKTSDTTIASPTFQNLEHIPLVEEISNMSSIGLKNQDIELIDFCDSSSRRSLRSSLQKTPQGLKQKTVTTLFENSLEINDNSDATTERQTQEKYANKNYVVGEIKVSKEACFSEIKCLPPPEVPLEKSLSENSCLVEPLYSIDLDTIHKNNQNALVVNNLTAYHKKSPLAANLESKTKSNKKMSSHAVTITSKRKRRHRGVSHNLSVTPDQGIIEPVVDSNIETTRKRNSEKADSQNQKKSKNWKSQGDSNSETAFQTSKSNRQKKSSSIKIGIGGKMLHARQKISHNAKLNKFKSSENIKPRKLLRRKKKSPSAHILEDNLQTKDEKTYDNDDYLRNKKRLRTRSKCQVDIKMPTLEISTNECLDKTETKHSFQSEDLSTEIQEKKVPRKKSSVIKISPQQCIPLAHTKPRKLLRKKQNSQSSNEVAVMNVNHSVDLGILETITESKGDKTIADQDEGSRRLKRANDSLENTSTPSRSQIDREIPILELQENITGYSEMDESDLNERKVLRENGITCEVRVMLNRINEYLIKKEADLYFKPDDDPILPQLVPFSEEFQEEVKEEIKLDQNKEQNVNDGDSEISLPPLLTTATTDDNYMPIVKKKSFSKKAHDSQPNIQALTFAPTTEEIAIPLVHAKFIKKEVVQEPDFKSGSFVWAQLSKFPFWPAYVCEEPGSKDFKRIMGGYKTLYYHVRFFGDKGRRAWVSQKNIMLFCSKMDLELIANKLKAETSIASVIKPYIIYSNLLEKWKIAVDELELSKSKSYADIIKMFDNAFDQARTYRKKSVGVDPRDSLDPVEIDTQQREASAISESISVGKQKNNVTNAESSSVQDCGTFGKEEIEPPPKRLRRLTENLITSAAEEEVVVQRISQRKSRRLTENRNVVESAPVEVAYPHTKKLTKPTENRNGIDPASEEDLEDSLPLNRLVREADTVNLVEQASEEQLDGHPISTSPTEYGYVMTREEKLEVQTPSPKRLRRQAENINDDELEDNIPLKRLTTRLTETKNVIEQSPEEELEMSLSLKGLTKLTENKNVVPDAEEKLKAQYLPPKRLRKLTDYRYVVVPAPEEQVQVQNLQSLIENRNVIDLASEEELEDFLPLSTRLANIKNVAEQAPKEELEVQPLSLKRLRRLTENKNVEPDPEAKPEVQSLPPKRLRRLTENRNSVEPTPGQELEVHSLSSRRLRRPTENKNLVEPALEGLEAEVLPQKRIRRLTESDTFKKPLAEWHLEMLPSRVRSRKQPDDVSDAGSKTSSDVTTNTSNSYSWEAQIDLFKRNNLFKGLSKDKVCQYCLEFGEIFRCKSCSAIYHYECSTLITDLNRLKKKRGRSSIKPELSEKSDILEVDSIPENKSISERKNTLDTNKAESEIAENQVQIVTIMSNKPPSQTPEKTLPLDYQHLRLDEKIDLKMKEVMSEFEDKTVYYVESSSNESNSEEDSMRSKSGNLPHPTLDDKIVTRPAVKSKRRHSLKCVPVEFDSFDETPSTSNSSSPSVTSRLKEIRHVTADGIMFQNFQFSYKNESDFKCGFCSVNMDPYCFVCHLPVSRSGSDLRIKCSLYRCGKYYHKQCLKMWPQTQWSLIKSTKHRDSIEEIDSFVCPSHVCHTCASDDPRAAISRCPSDKTVKCLRCPASYHSTNYCVPAGTEILSSTQILCPRHRTRTIQPLNTTWCFICSEGGNLICCENCPTSVHPECQTVNLTDDDKFICEDCESGRLPLYDEVVWVKLGSYRWWPAMILFPNEVPDNVRLIKHQHGDFTVKFFGTNDYYWVNKTRSFLFQEGDKGHPMERSKKKIYEIFGSAIEQAALAHKFKKEFKQRMEAESLSSLKPPPYIKIKVNKPVGNVRTMDLDLSNSTACSCDASQPHPCGPDSDCINRLLLTECDPDVCPAGKRCRNQSFDKREYAPMTAFKTQGRGWGLKSLAPIKKGQFVIEYVGEVIDSEEYQRRILKMHEQKEENYYFLTIDKDRMIDAGPKGNLSRFMNHSCNPNCETQKWTVNGDTRVGLFAMMDIPVGNELTFNYNLECVGKEKKPCRCGAPNCSGFIGVKAKQDNVDVKRTKKSYKKKEPEKPTITPCFLCKKKSSELICNNKSCNKGYHMKCLKLTEVPEASKFVCPRHNCNICSNRTIRCCVKCTNSFCPTHAEGNVRHESLVGFLCTRHDPTLTTQKLPTHKRRSSPVTDEYSVTSTTSVGEYRSKTKKDKKKRQSLKNMLENESDSSFEIKSSSPDSRITSSVLTDSENEMSKKHCQ